MANQHKAGKDDNGREVGCVNCGHADRPYCGELAAAKVPVVMPIDKKEPEPLKSTFSKFKSRFPAPNAKTEPDAKE